MSSSCHKVVVIGPYNKHDDSSSSMQMLCILVSHFEDFTMLRIYVPQKSKLTLVQLSQAVSATESTAYAVL